MQRSSRTSPWTRGALRGISLTLRGGELTALERPAPGIGKTSLLRAIVRLDEPAAAACASTGRTRGLDPRALRRRVGFVAQAPVMLPGTVRDNLAFVLPSHGGARAAGRARGGPASTPALPGPRRGCAVGRRAGARGHRAALTRDPGCAAARRADRLARPGRHRRIERLLRALAARGLALLVVTHDAAQAERIADHASSRAPT